MNMNMKKYGTPVVISTIMLNYDFVELEQLLQDKLIEHKQKSES